jgi:hypothetical protein
VCERDDRRVEPRIIGASARAVGAVESPKSGARLVVVAGVGRKIRQQVERSARDPGLVREAPYHDAERGARRRRIALRQKDPRALVRRLSRKPPADHGQLRQCVAAAPHARQRLPVAEAVVIGERL